MVRGIRKPITQIELFTNLQAAASRKFQSTPQIKDFMPAIDCDFSPFFVRIIPKQIPNCEVKNRHRMDSQWRMLQYNARGLPEIVALNMLFVSYLRRETELTEKAHSMFFRLWETHGEELLLIIPTRDLISSLRTVADHSKDVKQRLVAKMVFTYAHLIKTYESERVAEGCDPAQANYTVPHKSPKLGIEKLWGVRFGGDNSFEIVHALLAEEIVDDNFLSLMALEVIKRIHDGETIFSRFDKARLDADFNTHTQRNWSFGSRPKFLKDAEEQV